MLYSKGVINNAPTGKFKRFGAEIVKHKVKRENAK